jgi:hypothetical protein
MQDARARAGAGKNSQKGATWAHDLNASRKGMTHKSLSQVSKESRESQQWACKTISGCENPLSLQTLSACLNLFSIQEQQGICSHTSICKPTETSKKSVDAPPFRCRALTLIHRSCALLRVTLCHAKALKAQASRHYTGVVPYKISPSGSLICLTKLKTTQKDLQCAVN